MQKKLEAELMSLAHAILKMKKGDDVAILTERARKVYQQLSVLSYIDGYVKETPQNEKSFETLVEETFNKPEVEEVAVMVSEAPLQEEVADIPQEEPVLESEEPLQEETVAEGVKVSEEITEDTPNDLEELSEVFEPINQVEKEPVVEETPVVEKQDLQSSLEKEFGTNVSLDMTTDLFENAQRITPQKSINDVVMQQKSLQIGLNDRIAFVKHLFEGSQEDFNRVVSQLNTMETEKEALSFLKMIKKEYNWDGKEVYEERLLLLIDRKFN